MKVEFKRTLIKYVESKNGEVVQDVEIINKSARYAKAQFRKEHKNALIIGVDENTVTADIPDDVVESYVMTAPENKEVEE